MTLEFLETGLFVALVAVAARAVWGLRSVPNRRVLRASFAMLAAVAAAALVLGWRVDLARGASMQPTLGRWAVLVVDRSVSRDGLEAGDIIVFQSPGQTPSRLSKRVVGLPGDLVSYQHGELFVNGHEVASAWRPASLRGLHQPGPLWVGVAAKAKRPFRVLSDRGAHASGQLEVRVPPDHYFLMGDNWGNSHDSRDFGPVPLAKIRGKLVVALFGEVPWKSP